MAVYIEQTTPNRVDLNSLEIEANRICHIFDLALRPLLYLDDNARPKAQRPRQHMYILTLFTGPAYY